MSNPPHAPALRAAAASLFFALATLAPAVVINEFVASNGSTLADEDGAFEDWIELFNPGAEDVDLAGWGISDNLSNRFKWTFPETTIIPANGHLVLWASGKDRTPGAEIPGLLRELWLGIPGVNVSDLVNHASFPGQPSSVSRLTDFFEAPSNIADNYGQRVSGLLVAPDTGNYRFWIASDDAGELRISTGEDPAHATMVASVPGWTSPRQWNKYASQMSQPIALVAGQKYYVEALMKEGGGGDNLALRWELPDGTIEELVPAHHFISTATGQLHTSFRISSAGEPLVLTRPDGTTADQLPPVYMPRDVSYGRLADGAATWHYFADPTPGTSNTSTPVTLPPTVTISEPRGFREAPFTVTLAASDPEALIRYTLNGSTPGPSSPVYTSPILITSTTTLRASAVGPGMIQLPPTTTTWIFLDDVLQQGTSPPPGWPADRQVNNHKMEYGMRADIVSGDNQRLRQGMKSIPSISLVTDLDHLFGVNSGIYSYSNIGYGWERPVSVELIDPQGDPGAEFQIDAGLRLRGAYSRSVENPKHSLRLFFRSGYGDRRLEFPLFGDEGASSFDKVDLRTAQNYSWSFANDNRNTFQREIFSRDTQRDMGMPYTRSRYYHLYINGRYWGIYMSQERAEADWAATYLGGDADDWDTIKTSQPGYVSQAADGNFAAFNNLHHIAINEGFTGPNAANYWRVRGLNPDGTPNPAFPVLLDEDNLINYMLVAHYTGDRDSPVSLFMNPNRPNNMYALFNRAAPGGFRWLRHDAEHSLGVRGDEGVTWDPTFIGQNITAQNNFNPATLHWRLAAHPEYRMRVADLMQRHLFGDGALTPAKARARVQARMAQIDLAIIGESARWGRGRTRDAHWLPACNAILSYLDQRRDIIVSHYRNRGWFPQINAPVPSLAGASVSLASGTPFYYMTDGSDPRLPGGGIRPEALLVQSPAGSSPVEVVARGAVWRYYDLGAEPPAFGDVNWNDPDYPASSWQAGPAILGFAGATPQNPVATQTRRWVAGTSGPQVTTTYLRHEFTLASADGFAALAMEILRDDGAMVYLNGVEILRDNMPDGAIGYDTEAASVVGGTSQTTRLTHVSDAVHLLRPGLNVLAASVHQRGATSSDKYFDLALSLTPSPPAIIVPVHMAPGIRARSFQGGEWSALSDLSTMADLPEPVSIHQWDFESTTTFLEPSTSVGGAALATSPGPTTAILRNTAAQDFPTAHLRVNDPLGASLTWSLPSTGFGALSLSWETRRSGQGAGTQSVEISTDGVAWQALATYPVFDAAPQPHSFELSGFADAADNPLLALRVSFAQGEGGTSGNNRFDNLTLTGIPLQGGAPPASLAFQSAPIGASSGTALAPVVVRLLDADGNPAVSYNGPVTLSLAGPGSLSGSLTVDAANGTATFEGLVLSGTGAHQLVAEAAGLAPATSATFQSLSLAALVVPRFIQGGQDAGGENNDRVPFAWLARIDGLLPGATYRFANRAVSPADPADSDGAGNMVFVTGHAEDWVRTTSSPRFRPEDLGSRHFTFTADAAGSFAGWFVTEPTGNARFTPGNAVHLRLLLNDGGGGEAIAHVLTTAESAQAIRFGTGPGEGTAIIGESSSPARHLALLYDEAEGTSRPLAATPVEVTGAEVDARYAAFYQGVVATSQGHWGSILPNSLPGGLRRIEIREATGEAATLDTRVAAGGFPGTVDPDGGLAAPILLDADAGLPVFLPGGNGTWHSAANWLGGTIPDAPGARAIVNAPASADRNVNVNAPATVGGLRANQGNTSFRNRVRNNHANGTLTFDGGDAQPATLRVEGAGGTGHVDLDFSNPVTLATDLILLVNQPDGDPQHGALRLQQAWAGPGGLIKQGPGVATLSGEGKSFTGPVTVAQGVLRLTGPAVPAAAGGISVLPGGQLRLVSAGTFEQPRDYPLPAPLTLAGPGRSGVGEGAGLGVLGALRYEPGAADSRATIPTPIALAAEASIHVAGTTSQLDLTGPLSGTQALAKSGGGTLMLAADSPDFDAPIAVDAGALMLAAHLAAPIHLAAQATLSGHGSCGAISGQGALVLGRTTLAAPDLDGPHAHFIFSAHSPDFSSPQSAENGTLIASSASPSSVSIYLDAPDLSPGDRFQGGLALPVGSGWSAVLARLTVYHPDPTGAHHFDGRTWAALGTTLAAAVPAQVNGLPAEILEVFVTDGPTSFAAWQAAAFPHPADLANPLVSGPDAAPFGDGIANILRYAFGVPGDAQAAALQPYLDPAATGAQALRLRHNPLLPDIRYQVLASHLLDDWPSAEILFDSSTSPTPLQDDQGWITVPDPAPPSPRRFYSTRIIYAPPP